MIYFSASRGVSLIAEFDKVPGPFSEKVRLTTEIHHICMVAELVRPDSSAAERLHELATCLETVVVYFSTSRGVSLVAAFDKVRGQFPEKVLLTTENHHIVMVAELVWLYLLSCGTIARACHMPGDGRDISQHEQRCLLGAEFDKV